MEIRLGLASRWLGRIAALLLLVFWGGFFLEHLTEWFLRPDGRLPPMRVWIGMLFHLGMLIGLVLVLRWERAGIVVLLASTFGFAVIMRDSPGRMLLAVNLAPIACIALARLFRPPIRAA